MGTAAIRSQQLTVLKRSEEENIFSVRNNPSKLPVAKLNIHGSPIEFITDTGATVNLIEQRDFSAIQNKVKLQPTSVKVYRYKSCKPLKILRTFSAQIKNSGNSDNAHFFVVPNDRKLRGSLLSFSTARNLGLIALTNRIAPSTKRRSVLIPDQLFHGVGKLKNRQVDLHIDKTIQPVAQPHRPIPFHVRKLVEKEH